MESPCKVESPLDEARVSMDVRVDTGLEICLYELVGRWNKVRQRCGQIVLHPVLHRRSYHHFDHSAILTTRAEHQW